MATYKSLLRRRYPTVKVKMWVDLRYVTGAGLVKANNVIDVDNEMAISLVKDELAQFHTDADKALAYELRHLKANRRFLTTEEKTRLKKLRQDWISSVHASRSTKKTGGMKNGRCVCKPENI